MNNIIKNIGFIAIALLALVSCGQKDSPELTIYSGRKKNLSDPLYKLFTEKTGIKIVVKEGKTASLANLLMEEGQNSSADLFFAQDASNLAALSSSGKLAILPEEILAKVDPRFYGPKKDWIGTSGRARTLVYNTDMLTEEQLPKSILDLTKPQFKNLVGWAPKNGSFQSHTTAMRSTLGEEATAQWLTAMVANGAKVYPKNSPIVAAVARGEIACGLVNHYYLYKNQASSKTPVKAKNHFFVNGDAGLMLNVSGIALVKASKKSPEAIQFIEFLLSEEAQQFFVNENYEYPMIKSVSAAEALKPLTEINPPAIDLGSLDDIKATVELLKKTKALN